MKKNIIIAIIISVSIITILGIIIVIKKSKTTEVNSGANVIENVDNNTQDENQQVDNSEKESNTDNNIVEENLNENINKNASNNSSSIKNTDNNKANNSSTNNNNNNSTSNNKPNISTPNKNNISNTNNNIDNEPTVYTVYFNSNGGSSIQSQNIEEGNCAVKPQNPSRSGYDFVEWTLNNEIFDFSKKINGNITLVAKWEKKAYTYSEADAIEFANKLKSYSNSKGMTEGPYEPVQEDAMSEHFYTSKDPYADPESFNEKYSRAKSFIDDELAKVPNTKKLIYRISIQPIKDGASGQVKRYEVWMFVHSVDK